MGTLKLGDVTLHDCGGHRLSVSYFISCIFMGLNFGMKTLTNIGGLTFIIARPPFCSLF